MPMTFNRRQALLAGSAAASFLVPTFKANAAEFSLKFGNSVPADHPTNIAAQLAADRIKKESGGRVELNVFPSNQLGADTDMLSQARSGALDFYCSSAPVLGSLIPVVSVSGIGFAFKDYDTLWAALDGDLGAHVRSAIPQAGLIAMDKMWDYGFRQITTTSRPINTAEDLQRLKIRVPVSTLWQSLFKAFGAAPVGINFAELYSALQTRLVEGQENALPLIKISKLYEVQKYCSLTNHMWDGVWILTNKTKWNAMPPAVRELVARNFDLAAIEQRRMIADLNVSAQVELEKAGLIYNKPDTASFRAALTKANFYSEWKGKIGADTWAILEKYAGSLA